MSIHALQPDYILQEYRIIKLLGEGGFGLTYLAFDTNLEKNVAIKEYMPNDHAIRDKDSKIVPRTEQSEKTYNWGLNAFLNEAKTLAKYENPNIVRIYRYFKENGTAYIVMEYCEGGCLVDKIDKNKHMDEGELKEIVSSLVRGLQLVHNDGILHRDIKPENIMFRKNGSPVLIDFGAARQAIGVKSRKVTTIITPGFAPLEQYSSKGSIGPWSDIYSLSAVAYMCLTGKRPPDIMNRLHEDNIKKLAEKNHSSLFLKSIDDGLNLQVNDRPKSLSEWSAKWNNYKIPVSSEFALKHVTPLENEKQEPSIDKNRPPIVASKVTTDEQLTVRSPISARTHLNSQNPTIVNTFDTKQGNNKQPSGFLKFLKWLLFIVLLSAGIFYAYPYYVEYKDAKITKQKNSDQLKIQTMQAQKALNQLGFKVSEDGLLDTRTTESIKQFEKNNKLIVTGKVDDILLNELKRVIQLNKTSSIEQNNQTDKTEEPQEQTIKDKVDEKSDNDNNIQQEAATKPITKPVAKPKIKPSTNTKPKTDSRLALIAKQKKLLIKDIQKELKRLNFSSLSLTGNLDLQTKSSIKKYQKIRKLDQNGLPSKTLLFKLKSEKQWPAAIKRTNFKDCSLCPDMIFIPSGSFLMGSNTGKENEKPIHKVYVDAFFISQTEVTFTQWDACFDDGFCTHRPDDETLGRDDLAVMNINFYDIQQFFKWLKFKTGKLYRLPSEAEWEYAARAGTKTDYPWGNTIGINNVSCKDCEENFDINKHQVKSYKPNSFSLYDMHGNVWEWTQDCWHSDYLGAPNTSVAWEPIGCENFVLRGGSSGNPARDLRSSARGVLSATKRLNTVGFRVAISLD